MLIVKFGEGKFQRVGVVIGEYDHTLHGRVKMVRTPYNYITGQQFDNVPAGKVQPATWEELLAHADDVRRECDNKIEAFIDMASPLAHDDTVEVTSG
jgi:hypothetical protein